LLASRAAARLAGAGRRASARGDFSAATNLFERALELGLGDPRERVQVEIMLGDALYERRRTSESEAALAHARDDATALGAGELVARARVRIEVHRLELDLELEIEPVLTAAERAIATMSDLDDERGLALAEELVSIARIKQGQSAASIQPIERALALATRAGEHDARRRLVRALSIQLGLGPTPVARAIGRCEQLLVSSRDDPTLEAAIRRSLSWPLAMAGRFEEALDQAERSAIVLDELDSLTWTFAARITVGQARELAGDRAGAERDFQAQWRSFREAHGPESVPAVNASSLLALFYCDEGRWEEAEACLAPTEGMLEPAWYRQAAVTRLAASARVAAHHGDHAEATRRAERAVDLAETSDYLNLRARLWLALEEVQQATGHIVRADAVARALGLFEQKGNVAAAARLRAEHRTVGPTQSR
jgi:tetratricopeptide (TPR) repeat protein